MNVAPKRIALNQRAEHNAFREEKVMSRSPAVNVQTFLNEHPFSGFQWLIFAMCFVIVLLDGFDTAAIGFIASITN